LQEADRPDGSGKSAALRGHRVILYEKEPQLGGSLPVAAVVKGSEREDLMSIIDYLKFPDGLGKRRDQDWSKW